MLILSNGYLVQNGWGPMPNDFQLLIDNQNIVENIPALWHMDIQEYRNDISNNIVINQGALAGRLESGSSWLYPDSELPLIQQ